MKKVFHIVPRFDVGGAERVAISIASSDTEDMEYHIVEVMRGNSKFTENIISELVTKGIKYHRALIPVIFHWHYLCERSLSFIFPIRFLCLWLRYHPDVIHSHTEVADTALWVSMKLFPFIKVKIVRTIHNTRLWTGMNIIGPRVEHFMQYNKANIAISKNVQKAYFDIYGGEPPIIYNGVSPTSQVHFKGVVPGKVNICFAGRFEEQKGIDALCRIVTILQDDERYYFHIFGSGRLQPLVDKIKELPNVSVNPPLFGISAYLSSFDYLIMPSIHEGLSILALEASFNGLPLLINHCDGLTDTLPSEWPLAVENNGIRQWKNIFDNVLPSINHDELCKQAYEFAKAHFSISKMQKEYEHFYRS